MEITLIWKFNKEIETWSHVLYRNHIYVRKLCMNHSRAGNHAVKLENVSNGIGSEIRGK